MRAASCFRQAWELARLPTALNNLGALHYNQGDPAAALEAIQPLLRDPEPLPYTHAMASICLHDLGQPGPAEAQLERAIADFEEGLRQWRARGPVPPEWIQYTVMIKRAAGELGQHRRVLQLHRRWPGKSLDYGLHYAGVAAFNLGWYAEAARLWRKLPDPDLASVTELYAFVAQQVERGQVPPFALEYEMLAPGDLVAATRADVRAKMVQGRFRVLSLAAAFKMASTPVEARALVKTLVCDTGDWGAELARRWQNDPTLPRLLKRAVTAVVKKHGNREAGQAR